MSEGVFAGSLSTTQRIGPHGQWSAVIRRLRVLLHTGPLLHLHRGDAHRDAESRHYDGLLLGLHVLDLVVERMGIDAEVNRDAVARHLEPLLTAMDQMAGVEIAADRHQEMVSRVLAALRNDIDARRPFSDTYLDVGVDGPAVERRLEFRILYDHFHPAGGTVLRLSNEAVNLYLGALELDIEDAQAAAEAVVHSQLARGKFADAVESARGARLQSMRFREKVVVILRETRRDLGRVDWREAVPRLLADALAHLAARLSVEEGIINAANERLDALAAGDAQALQVAEVRDIVRDCRLRHLELHRELIGARDVFLSEQARQSFVPPPLRRLPEPVADILDPLMRQALDRAVNVTDAVESAFLGATAPRVLSLAALLRWQLRPRREIRPDDVDDITPDPAPDEQEAPRFGASHLAAMQDILAHIHEPTRLSLLLTTAQAGETLVGLDRLVAQVALQYFAPDLDGEGMPPVHVDRVAGEALQARGWHGDELVISPGGSDP